MQQSPFVQMGAGVAVDGLAHFCSTAFDGNKARVSFCQSVLNLMLKRHSAFTAHLGFPFPPLSVRFS